jgi:hypothetical protein
MASSRRKLPAVVGSAALALGGLALVASPAAADGTTTYSAIQVSGTNMCLDDPNGTSANHEQMQIYYCNGGTNQQWTFVPGSTPGYGELVNGASGLCLDVTAASQSDGTNIQQYRCGTGNNQQWNYDPSTDYLRVLHSEKCLTVGDTDNHMPVLQYSCGLHLSQWQVNP